MAKVLIVGCGDIGAPLGRLLAAQGHEVTGLRRNPPSGNDGIHYCRGDIAAPGGLAALDKDYQQVFFIVSPDGRTVENYRAIYEIGINNLLEHFSPHHCQPAWIFVSSSSVYGQTQGEWVDEDSPAQPSAPTSQLIRQAEQRLLAANSHNIVLRFAGIYGPGHESLLRMARQAAAIQRDPPYYSNRIHQQDCVGVLAFLFRQRLAGRALESCYLGCDDAPTPMWEVASWLAARMHCPSPVAKPAGDAVSLNKRCSNRRLKALGYQFQYPSYRQGYLELLKFAQK